MARIANCAIFGFFNLIFVYKTLKTDNDFPFFIEAFPTGICTSCCFLQKRDKKVTRFLLAPSREFLTFRRKTRKIEEKRTKKRLVALSNVHFPESNFSQNCGCEVYELLSPSSSICAIICCPSQGPLRIHLFWIFTQGCLIGVKDGTKRRN